MKHIFFISLIWFIFTESLSAQESNKVIFTLHDKPNASSLLSIGEPLDGAFNAKVATFKQTITDSSDVVYIYKKPYPAIVRIETGGRSFDVIMSPNTVVNVDIYPQKKDDWFVFSGDNAAGQKLYNAKPLGIWITEIQKIFTDNANNSSSIYGHIEDYVASALYSIDSLKVLNEISSSFAEDIRKSRLIMIYANAVMSYEGLAHFIENGKLTAADSIVIQDSSERIYNTLPPFDSGILAYNIFGVIYLSNYLKWSYKNMDSSDQRFLSVFKKREEYGVLPDILQKPMLGYAIVYVYSYDTDEFDKDKATAFFREKYPDSDYLPVIDKIASSYRQSHANKPKENGNANSISPQKSVANGKITKKMPFDGDIHMDTSAVANNIKTLSELHETYFKGKKIYIDFWATWCLPCREEFAYKEQLDSLLSMHNITPVLISLDPSSLKEYWASFINKNNLKGFHFLINDALTQDVRRIAGYTKSSSGIPIPHYIYMDEHGDIVEKNAPRPSEIEKLEALFTKH